MKKSSRQLVDLAIAEAKRKGYPGAHVVYSGLNNALRKTGVKDPQKEVAALTKEGYRIRVCRGGAMIFAPDSKFKPKPSSTDLLLERLAKLK